MAWTKMKTAVVAVAGVLLAAGTATVTVKEIKNSHDNAIFEQIWAQPDSRSMNTLIHAPPALIIRPTHYAAAPGQGYWTDGRIGRGVWVNASVSELVNFAHPNNAWRTVFPADMPTQRFDLMETLPPGQNEPALKKEIQSRFGLTARTEIHDADVLCLVIRDTAKLSSHVSTGGSPSAVGTSAANNGMNYVLKNETLKDVASRLELYFRQPIVEPKEVAGRYDLTFHVDYKLQQDDLQQSFRDQLTQFGLELVPTNAPIEMLVVKKGR